jgi:uncharacterized protein
MPHYDFVVSNTSPLFYLQQIEKVDLLHALYNHLHVPQGVVTALGAGEKLGLKIPHVESFDWVTIEQISIADHLRRYTELGQGELEAISFAVKHPPSLVILDDRAARNAAQENNVEMTGTIGVLIAAKEKGLIPAFAPLHQNTQRGLSLERANLSRSVAACQRIIHALIANSSILYFHSCKFLIAIVRRS